MTITLFITLLSVLSTISSLVTEAIKQTTEITKPTLVVSIVSAVCGWGGGIAAYILMGIAITPASIVCLILLAPAVFLSATLGYDKVKEILIQIGKISK
jgi:hypothetical protein